MKRTAPGLAAVCFLALASVAAGQSPDAFTRAEQAYQEPDYQATLANAEEAVRAGNQSRQRLVRLYELIGLSAAALGDAERARDAYLRMLLIEPSQSVGDDVAPRLRAPYDEARGRRASLRGELGVDVGAVRDGRALRLAIGDPAQMAHEVVIGVRAPGEPAFTEIRRPTADEVVAPLPDPLASGERVEHWVRLVDVHGNHLVEIGSPHDPEVLQIRTAAAVIAPIPGPTPPAEPSRAEPSRPIWTSPWLWIAAGVVVVGGAIGTALALDATTERDARFSITF